jgi:hypothetical protein
MYEKTKLLAMRKVSGLKELQQFEFWNLFSHKVTKVNVALEAFV